MCTRIDEIKAYSPKQVESLREKGDDAANAINRLKAFDHGKERTPCGYYFYMSVKKREPGIYQDGTPIVEDEFSFYHGTNEGLVSSILTKGVCASIPSHKAEGLWVFSLLTPQAYDWGMSPFQFFGGLVLHLKIPACLEGIDGSTVLKQNGKIRADCAATGHLRWVLNGTYLSPHLRCRLVGIYVRVPSQAYMVWIKAFKQSVRNCIPWCHSGTFDPRSQALAPLAAQSRDVPGTKLTIRCKGSGVLNCLGTTVMCQGAGQQCLLHCVLEERKKNAEDAVAHLSNGLRPIPPPCLACGLWFRGLWSVGWDLAVGLSGAFWR